MAAHDRRKHKEINRRNGGGYALGLISGLGLGAGLMYALDPERGRRRRSLARDRMVGALHETQCAVDRGLRDLAHRAEGIVAEGWSAVRGRGAGDAVLEQRVRAKLGRVVSHPSAISVQTSNGTVTLRGPVLEAEVDEVIDSVSRVRGVRNLENQLEVHKQAGNIPGLQGGSGRPGERFELMQANWAPGTRLLLGCTGLLMTTSGLGRRGVRGSFMTVGGLALLTRSITNAELGRVFGLRGGRRGIEVQRTMNINAPIEQVYDFWMKQENLARIMPDVREIRRTGDGRFHWTVAGPAGVPVSWDAEITEAVPNQVVAWRSVPGSLVRNAGIIKFQPSPTGGTSMHIRISYNPPAGMVGHAVASLFGADPKNEIEKTLVRFKSLLETGKTTGAHGEEVTREQVAG